MLISVEHRCEVSGPAFGNIGHFGLETDHQSNIPGSGAAQAYQIQDALGMSLILLALREKEKAFAGLGRVSGIGVGNLLVLLAAQICGEAAVFQRLLAEPKVFLGKDQTPIECKFTM